jgi:hypothetical protein
MTTTQKDISRWLDEGKNRKDITHMIVVCDTFDYGDYPVYVTKQENINEAFQKYNGKNMQRVMEVYSFNQDLESQLNERRAFHFD